MTCRYFQESSLTLAITLSEGADATVRSEQIREVITEVILGSILKYYYLEKLSSENHIQPRCKVWKNGLSVL